MERHVFFENDSFWSGITNSTEVHLKSKEIALLTAYIVIGVIVCGLNSLTIWSVIQYRDLRTKTNMYIVSLAIADIFTGVTIPIYMANDMEAIKQLIESHFLLCPLRFMSIVVFVSQSFLSILAISVDRFIYIVYPLRYHNLVTVRRTGIIIAASWFLSAAMGFGVMHTYNVTEECNVFKVMSKEYLLYSLLPCWFLILFVTFLMYAAISWEAIKQRRRIQDQLSSTSHVLKFKMTIRSLRLFVTVYSVCMMCWAPACIVIIRGFTWNINHHALNITMCIGLLNSGVNFFLYVATNSDFKKALIKIFGRVCKCWTSRHLENTATRHSITRETI